ncbi:monoamine oxidase N [Aureobasidium pullulans]|nr:monoamine oxidase N [Aureobasidium pullulans]
MSSRDGYQWTESSGLVKGVPSISVIQPPTNFQTEHELHDVIVVGAGYCGLTAARDAALSGLKVLLLEARDRIGGRSWSSNIEGYPFEMGGTWVSWGQPHVWREISRYEMRDQLEISHDYSRGVNHFSLNSASGSRNMSHEDEDALMESALKKFANVDGQYGRIVMPFPHSESHNPEAAKYDKMSVADRIAQIKDDLSSEEHTVLLGFVLLCSCSTPEKTSFYEYLHWWALCNYSYEYCIEYLIKYKFKGGQSSFAINFFKEACSTGHLSYAFRTPIASINDDGSGVQAIARDGRIFKASRLISAIPMNILKDVTFSPPLAAGKLDASTTEHVNKCVKVHAEVRDRDLRSWSGITYPNNSLMYAIGDGTTPSGNTHIVAFGGQHNHLQPEKDIDKTMDALKTLTPMDIERVVFHNWADDEFAKGAWFFSPPGLVTEHLEDLRAPQGNMYFANSDWAVGWRSFIDGAIEEGTRAALAVKRDLDRSKIRTSST